MLWPFRCLEFNFLRLLVRHDLRLTVLSWSSENLESSCSSLRMLDVDLLDSTSSIHVFVHVLLISDIPLGEDSIIYQIRVYYLYR